MAAPFLGRILGTGPKATASFENPLAYDLHPMSDAANDHGAYPEETPSAKPSLSQRIARRAIGTAYQHVALPAYRRYVEHESRTDAPSFDPHLTQGVRKAGDAPVEVISSDAIRLPSESRPQTLTPELVQQRLAPSEGTMDWVHLNELINIELTPEGDVILTSKNYKEGAKGNLDWKKSLTGILRAMQVAIPANGILSAADMDSFFQVVATWGAFVISDNHLKLRIRGIENITPGKQYIPIPTHDSIAEFAVLFLVYKLAGIEVGFVADEKFKKFPLSVVLGHAMEKAPCVFFIDRKDKQSGRDTITQVADWLADPDVNYGVTVYTQGTRAPGREDENGGRIDGDLYSAQQGLKMGPFHMALQSNTPIIPIAINWNGVMPKGVKPVLDNQEVTVNVGRELHPENLDPALSKREKLNVMRDHVDDHFRLHRDNQPTREEVAKMEWDRRFDRDEKNLSNPKYFNGTNLTAARRFYSILSNPDHEEYHERARAALDKFYDKYFVGLNYHFSKSYFQRNEWLADRGINIDRFEEVVTLAERNNEFRAVKKRNKKSNGEKAHDFLHFVLPRSMYTASEQRRFGAAYLLEGARAMAAVSPEVSGQMSAYGMLQPADSDSPLVSSAKALAARMAERTNGREPLKILTEEEVQNLVDIEHQLEELPREIVLEKLRQLADIPEFTEVPEALVARVQESYGHDAVILERAKEYVVNYLNYLREYVKHALAIYEQDEAADHTRVEFKRAILADEISKATWNGEELPPEVFSMIMHASDAELIRDNHEFGNGHFKAILDAERQLGALHRSEAGRFEETEDFELRLAKARRAVSAAYRDYAKNFGLGSSDETFLHLHNSGLMLPHAHLKHIFSKPSFRRIRGIGEVLGAHAALFEEIELGEMYQDIDKKRQDARIVQIKKQRHTHFQQVMRRFLDEPGNARRLQAELQRVYWAIEAFGKNPTGFMWQVFGRAHPDNNFSQEERAYYDAMVRYEKSKDERDLGEVERVAKKLIDSDAILSLIDDAYALIEESQHDIDLADGRVAYRDYWATRREWAEDERARRDEILPLKISFRSWKQVNGDELLNEEDALNMAAARSLAAQATLTGVEGDRLRDDYRHFYVTYKDAELVYPDLTEGFGVQQKRLHRHAERMLNADLPEKKENAGHKVHYNRADEATGQNVITAYVAAARMSHLLKGEMPRPFTFFRPAMAEKLTPKLDMATHRENARNIYRYAGEILLPHLIKLFGTVTSGVPEAAVNRVILTWATKISTDFHNAQIDDRRSPVQLPGDRTLAHSEHSGGWFWDYSTTIFLSQHGRRFIPIAKAGLGDKKELPIAGAIPVAAVNFPDSRFQPDYDAAIAMPLLYGVYASTPQGPMAANGSQNIAHYAGLTMLVQSAPNIGGLENPEVLLSGALATGDDARGIGRDGNVLFSAASVTGTVSGLNLDLLHHHGVHGTAVKPNKFVGVNPTDGVTVVRPIDLLTFGMGDGLLGPNVIRTLNGRRQLFAEDTAWMKTELDLETSVRLLTSTP